MTPAVVRTAAANEDLRGIARHIGEEGRRPVLADRIIDELVDCCDRLAKLSSMSVLGSSKPGLAPGVRLFSYKRWVIIFRYIDTGVLVLRIADGSQDYLSWTFK